MLKQKLRTIEKGIDSGLNPNDLAQQMYEAANDAILDYDQGSSYRLTKDIDRLFAQKKKTMDAPSISKLTKVLPALRFMAFPKLSQRDALDLIESKLGRFLLDDHVNVYDKVRSGLLTLPVWERDEFKRKMLIRLQKNKEVISKIKLNFDGKELPATVSNIIRDFLRKSGVGQDPGLMIANYIEDRDFRNMTEEEKIKVQELLSVFYLLSTKSNSVEGLEEAIVYLEGGEIKIMEGGIITSLAEEKRKLPESIGFLNEPKEALKETGVEQEKKVSDTEREVLEAYQGDKKLQKAIAKEIKKLDKKFKGDKEGLRAEFFQVVQKGNINRTVGALMLMTQNDDLLEFISQDPKLSKFLAAIWEKQYGADLVADFKINPTDVKYVKLFLQYVLEQRLSLEEDDAARVGLQIGNAFAALGKKSYNKMAYFDVKSKKFNWFE